MNGDGWAPAMGLVIWDGAAANAVSEFVTWRPTCSVLSISELRLSGTSSLFSI
jgi:hypothetical protein